MYFTDLRKIFAFIVLLLMLSGCAESYRKHLPQITEAEITRTFEFGPAYTRVFIQNGKINRGYDHYSPNCNLEIRQKDTENNQRVNPGIYQIRDIQQTTQQVVKLPFDASEPIQVARFGLGIGIGMRDSPSYIYRGYHLNLTGPDSNVMRISCRGVYASPYDAELPTLKEMQQALGELIRLR